MSKTTGNKRKLSVIALTLVCCLAIAGVSAYFTDGDSTVNTFTVGKISLDLIEPEWIEPKNITPEQEIKKDPRIYNGGINDEYVFLKVEVPYSTVITAAENGTRNEKAATQLFSYTVNNGWMEFKPAEWSDADAKGNGVVTHYYAYASNGAMTALAQGVTTPALFNAVKFANVIEDQGLEQATLNINITAYGIQTANINNGDNAIDGTNGAGKTAPIDVWTVVTAQGPDTAEK